MTLAPVVVYPEMISKKASVNPSGVAHVMSGMMPNRPNTTHISAVMMNPSRGRIAPVQRRVAAVSANPQTAAAPAATRKQSQSLSP